MSSEYPPLPYGWAEEFDPKSNHPFWVDTKADPPRAIWTHPYEDEQYLQEHPEVKEKVGDLGPQQESDSKDPSSKARRHSFNGQDSDSMVPDDNDVPLDSSQKGKAKRGFFGKLKDKAIGTKEERQAHKKERERIERERMRQRAEVLKLQRERYAQQQAQQRALYGQGYPAGPSYPRYGPPPGNPYAYDPYGGYGYGGGGGYGYGGGGGYGYGYPRGRSRGSSAVPILGALAGGLLLGELIGGF